MIFQLIIYIYLLTIINAYAVARSHLETIVTHATHPLQIIRHFLPENPNILEAGGHHGEDTILMLTYWPNATIFSFEPNPSAYAKLEDRTKAHSGIFSYPLALYNYDGMVKFRVQLFAGNDGASSILPPGPDYSEASHVYDWWYIENEIDVPCITLNSLAKKGFVGTIDFMWLDMEGTELQVLKAGNQVLKNVKALYTEANFKEFRIGMTQYESLSKFLKEEGFEEIYFEGSRASQANVIYVRSTLLD